MMEYIKLPRGWLDDAVFGDEAYSSHAAWAWMVGEAAWGDGFVTVRGVRIEVKRGQILTSVRFMARKFRWSKSRVSRFIKRLKGGTAIGTEARTGQTLITICNYDAFQGWRDSGRDSNGDSDEDKQILLTKFTSSTSDLLQTKMTSEVEEVNLVSLNTSGHNSSLHPGPEVPKKQPRPKRQKKASTSPDDYYFYGRQGIVRLSKEDWLSWEQEFEIDGDSLEQFLVGRDRYLAGRGLVEQKRWWHSTRRMLAQMGEEGPGCPDVP